MREAAQVAKFSDNSQRGDEVNATKGHEAFDRWQPTPGFGVSAQRLCEPLDEFGGKPHRHSVLGEDDMLGGILEPDLGEKELMLRSPARAGISMTMAKQEGFEPLTHSALIAHCIFAGANQVANGFILRSGNSDWHKFARPMQSR
ncbi:hypothetical protein AWB66_06390 [Caballeronia telluris]|uniref:Uncharacterized protein n=1 Tax=Caballeronia telluris TaxID=326475 RepID=A0A158KKW3_9BURK|nr:hypothetical protein AWB66_06390 [Caballeronia telluris]